MSRIAHEWALNVAGQLPRASGLKQWQTPQPDAATMAILIPPKKQD